MEHIHLSAPTTLISGSITHIPYAHTAMHLSHPFQPSSFPLALSLKLWKPPLQLLLEWAGIMTMTRHS